MGVKGSAAVLGRTRVEESYGLLWIVAAFDLAYAVS